MTNDNILAFNPLDKRNLGKSVASELLEQTPVSMSNLHPFEGAGIYAIYYVGPFKAYSRISELNKNDKFEMPIYIGKAVPKGSRKGGDLNAPPGKVLYNRINQHSKSIIAAENLVINDFFCRYLVVDDIWIPLGETLLISQYHPIWNKMVDGFGNHDPGSGRHSGRRPKWDVLHPGRAWADNCAPREETREQIESEIEDYLRSHL